MCLGCTSTERRPSHRGRSGPYAAVDWWQAALVSGDHESPAPARGENPEGNGAARARREAAASAPPPCSVRRAVGTRYALARSPRSAASQAGASAGKRPPESPSRVETEQDAWTAMRNAGLCRQRHRFVENSRS